MRLVWFTAVTPSLAGRRVLEQSLAPDAPALVSLDVPVDKAARESWSKEIFATGTNLLMKNIGHKIQAGECQRTLDGFVMDFHTRMFRFSDDRLPGPACDLPALFAEWKHVPEATEGLLLLMLASSSNTGLSLSYSGGVPKVQDLVRVKQDLFSSVYAAAFAGMGADVDNLLGLYLLRQEGFQLLPEDWVKHRDTIKRILPVLLSLRPAVPKPEPSLAPFAEWLVYAASENPIILSQPVLDISSDHQRWIHLLSKTRYPALTRVCPVSLLSDQLRNRFSSSVVQTELLTYLIDSAAKADVYPSVPGQLTPETAAVIRSVPTDRHYQREALVKLILTLAALPGPDANRMKAIGCGVNMINEWKMFATYGKSETEVSPHILGVEQILTQIAMQRPFVPEMLNREYSKFVHSVQYLLTPTN